MARLWMCTVFVVGVLSGASVGKQQPIVIENVAQISYTRARSCLGSNTIGSESFPVPKFEFHEGTFFNVTLDFVSVGCTNCTVKPRTDVPGDMLVISQAGKLFFAGVFSGKMCFQFKLTVPSKKPQNFRVLFEIANGNDDSNMQKVSLIDAKSLTQLTNADFVCIANSLGVSPTSFRKISNSFLGSGTFHFSLAENVPDLCAKAERIRNCVSSTEIRVNDEDCDQAMSNSMEAADSNVNINSLEQLEGDWGSQTEPPRYNPKNIHTSEPVSTTVLMTHATEKSAQPRTSETTPLEPTTSSTTTTSSPSTTISTSKSPESTVNSHSTTATSSESPTTETPTTETMKSKTRRPANRGVPLQEEDPKLSGFRYHQFSINQILMFSIFLLSFIAALAVTIALVVCRVSRCKRSQKYNPVHQRVH